MEATVKAESKIFLTIDENFNSLMNTYGNGIGLIVSKNCIFSGRMQMGLAYIECITDSNIILEHVLSTLLSGKLKDTPDNMISYIRSCVISVADTMVTDNMAQLTEFMLKGYAAIFLEETPTALLIGCRKAAKKAVESPENESTVLGSQESFTDDMYTNKSLLLKRLPVPGLHFEEFTVGTLSHVRVELIWLNGVADMAVIEEAKSRINRINYDIVDGIGVLGELIEDKPNSIFPKYRQTERPDIAARSLSEGRFMILCDSSPFALIAPVTFWDNFKTMDDYEDRPLVSSYIRLVRYISFLLSTLIAALYVSFVTYNQSIVPSTLALAIAASREGVPFPTIIEMLLMMVSITIIREAGLRMPQSVAYFVGALAAVVIGQAIVTAGYVSAPLIIVVAISTIASFALSSTTLLYPARILNYSFILLAGFFGIFGVINGLVIVFWYLTSLSSFGVPYLYPLLPFDKNGFKDLFVRMPFKNLNKRMRRLAPGNLIKSGKNAK